MLEVKVEQQCGDLRRSHSNKHEEAKKLYTSAMEKLNSREWKNCVSKPKKKNSRNTVFCDIGGNDEEQEPKVTRKGGNAQNELKVDCTDSCGCGVTCVRDEVNCWHCVPSGVMKSSSLTSIIDMKWEFTRRRLLVKLWIEIGESLWVLGKTREAHKAILESISVLVNRSTFRSQKFKIPFTLLTNLIKNKIIGEMFVVEHAALLYTICWLSLRNNGRRKDSCEMFNLSIPTVVSGLKLSLIGCREVPELFQKVSRLLAVMYTLSPSWEPFSMLDSSSNSLLVSQWASYFHQASLGAHINCRLFSRLLKQKHQNAMDVDSPPPSSSTCLSLHRLISKSEQDLEEFILKFFQGLPRSTIICISILRDDYASWLSNLLLLKPTAHQWIMFSRLNSDCAPIVIVLPIVSILAGNPDDDEKKTSGGRHCLGGLSVVDQIAPLFRTIMEELSSLRHSKEWWRESKKIDQRGRDLLRDMDDAWFGPWKDLLLGGLSDYMHLDGLEKKLSEDLKSQCNIDVHEDVIKAIVRGVVQRVEKEKRKKVRKGKSKIDVTEDVTRQQVECLSKLMTKKGCYIGGKQFSNDGSKVSELLSNSMNTVEDEAYVDREPVILVPDLDIHMLPWERFPSLRDQEVYRVPSVACIEYACEKKRLFQEKEGEEDCSFFPVIDPLDAYYLLNPGGDLPSINKKADLFKQRIKKGSLGTSPGVDELSRVLKEHQLFIYVGHGSGNRHIPNKDIQEFERCAAAILMGCNSGLLSMKGPYIPVGTPLSYLLAGSPTVIANLWIVDKASIPFTLELLDGWFKARSGDCVWCTQLSDELNDSARKGKRKLSSKAVEVTFGCKHMARIGSFIAQARAACSLPFLTGAAPVCYGVPTYIFREDL